MKFSVLAIFLVVPGVFSISKTTADSMPDDLRLKIHTCIEWGFVKAKAEHVLEDITTHGPPADQLSPKDGEKRIQALRIGRSQIRAANEMVMSGICEPSDFEVASRLFGYKVRSAEIGH